jgi:hypothetical protein
LSNLERDRQTIKIATSLCDSATLINLLGNVLTWQTALRIARELYDDGLRGVENECMDV